LSAANPNSGDDEKLGDFLEVVGMKFKSGDDELRDFWVNGDGASIWNPKSGDDELSLDPYAENLDVTRGCLEVAAVPVFMGGDGLCDLRAGRLGSESTEGRRFMG